VLYSIRVAAAHAHDHDNLALAGSVLAH